MMIWISRSGGTWAQIASVGADARSYQNTGLSRNTIYYYRVRATDGSTSSNYSNEAWARTLKR